MQLQKISAYDPYSYMKAKETEQIKAVTLAQQTRYFEEMPAQSFRDVLNVSANASNPYVSDLPVSDFSRRVEFEPTGDPERDKNIRYAIDYYSSCFDFTNKWDYDKLTAEEDFIGMSNAEKYKAIYEKYQHCYGENFLEASAVDYELIPSDYDHWSKVIRQFKQEVNDACGGAENAEEARRDALYGEGLSNAEVRQAIIEKYVHDGKITNRDFCKMTNEMDLCGVGGGINSSNSLTSRRPNNIFEYLREKNHIAAREATMDCYITELDIKSFIETYNHRCYLNNVLPEYGAALKQIVAALEV